jgi:hypothetical protein
MMLGGMKLFSSVVLTFSYSIKLLAVQELLDKEALEKVNILLFLPHIHKQSRVPPMGKFQLHH